MMPSTRQERKNEPMPYRFRFPVWGSREALLLALG